MNKRFLPLTALAAAATFTLGAIAPASADQAAATRNAILGAAAVVAGIAIESNVSRKNAAASRVQGYTRNGGMVYGDGRIVERDGTTYYPGNNGQTVDCNNGSCVVDGTYNNNGGYNNGGYNNGGYNNGGYDNRGYNNGNRNWNGNENGNWNQNNRGYYGNSQNGNRWNDARNGR
ncbi:MAG: hypothetical protein ABR591_03380 [Candidatus Velthaea sp.]